MARTEARPSTTSTGIAAHGVARTPGRILLVEDDVSTRTVYGEALAGRGHAVQTSSDGAGALALLARERFDLVVSDVRMPGIDGRRLLQRIQEDFDHLRVILVTGFGDVSEAVEAMRGGAYHYLCKPVRLDTLIEEVERGLAGLRREPSPTAAPTPAGGLIVAPGFGPLTVRILSQAARTSCPVLLEGERGAGRRDAADLLHRQSPRSAARLAVLDCGGAGAAGALVGDDHAGRRSPCILEQAAKGSVLLLELDALPTHAQRKLALFVHTGQMPGTSGQAPRRSDVRVLATLTGGIVESVEEGRLIEDLAYRFHVVRMPPLREQLSDLPRVVRALLDDICDGQGRAPRDLSPRAMEMVLEHPWVGNLAELRRVLEAGVSASRHACIRPGDLPITPEDRADGSTASLRLTVREHVKAVLAQAGGNKLKAAALLGISRPTLYRKLLELGLS